MPTPKKAPRPKPAARVPEPQAAAATPVKPTPRQAQAQAKKKAKPRVTNGGAATEPSASGESTGKLTDRQRKFCENLNRGMSAAEAARKAGYSEKYASQRAHALIYESWCTTYLDVLRAESRTEAVADGREVREYLTKVLRDEVQDVATGGKELEYIHTPMPAAERTRAAQELAKLDGLYAPTRIDLKVAEYSKNWLKEALAVAARYIKDPVEFRRFAAELPRFDP